MRMKTVLTLLLSAAVGTASADPVAPGLSKPNIVFLLADDLGWAILPAMAAGPTKPRRSTNLPARACDSRLFTVPALSARLRVRAS